MILTARANRDIKYIVIHHSATPNGRPVDAAEIHTWHRLRGWDGIGYNYVVLEDGGIESGRPEYWVGAHAAGHNETSIGVCLIGTGEPEGHQLDMARQLVGLLRDRYPTAEVVGHRDLPGLQTECPGYDVSVVFT